jgi:hypothetical protein
VVGQPATPTPVERCWRWARRWVNRVTSDSRFERGELGLEYRL